MGTTQARLPAASAPNAQAQQRNHVNRSRAALSSLLGLAAEVRSSGTRVVDENGQEYLNAGGYGVFLLGHCHPYVVDRVVEQVQRLPLSTRLLMNQEEARAAAAVAEITPAGLQYVLFTNSGAEATEAGLKLAALNGKDRLVAMHNGFHGKSIGALSVTGRERYREPFGRLLFDVEFVEFGNIEQLHGVLERQKVECAVILEPVQAEGGVIVPPPGYLRSVRELCDRYGALLLLDEIQTGLGRLGTWWGADRESVSPDVLLIGKGLSGGIVPVGAAVATPKVFEPLNHDPLLHSSTFGGSPLAAAAAIAAIETIRREGLVERARELGVSLLRQIRDILGSSAPEQVVEVRGLGLLIGIELRSEGAAGELLFELLKRRVIASHSLNSGKVIRLTPPAIFSQSDCAWLLEALGDAGASVERAAADRQSMGSSTR